MIGTCKSAFYSMLEEIGGLFLFTQRIFRVWRCTKGCWTPIMAQIHFVTFRSLPTVAFAGVFVGAILVVQFNVMLREFDAQAMLGGMSASAIIREVGPLIISFLLAGKIGAYTAAELGTMRVTEQIDAIECLGTDPFQYLIVPRFFGILFSSLVLLLVGLVISIMGAIGVAHVLCNVAPLQFASTIGRFTGPETVISGFFKSLVYGFIVASVACFKGYTATGGARGVGRAVTAAAVFTNLYIVIANYLVSNLLEYGSELYDAIVSRFFA